ncbi:hypothetical protein ZRA01_27060 [Zoogloea ramigera]|uniref:MAP3K TRAFs-binding domain-containing protein n=1 Tax=Zoogloea ramigera TaxID=350 RepID=A0A4Y4CZ93_ZOORA|nr:TRAFs-binding domain-containing protein [Zoogloea ramigera]GEC96633.1 hypothetical protein ZRA01_27060 [Zoogloea ramigera]
MTLLAKPLCAVLMPSGSKRLPSGQAVDFDALYTSLIEPGIVAACMTPLRADAEAGGGIHAPLHERLLLCDYAVADLTCGSAAAFYQLGLRDGLRPATTVTLVGEASPLPLAPASPGAIPYAPAPPEMIRYALAADGRPADAAAGAEALTRALGALRRLRFRPLFQLIEGPVAPDIARLKTDLFREQARYAPDARQALAAARQGGREAVRAVAAGLGEVSVAEPGVVIDLLLSLRAVGDWQGMVDVVGQMGAPLARSTLVQEQYGLALNRLGRADEAGRVLEEVIATRGPSSETNGLLGRVYKDRWGAARQAGRPLEARGWLGKAIAAYLQGFEADWRDAFPGINAVTLMELASPPDPRRVELVPLVAYAVKRRIARGAPDYWDHASLVELAVLARDEAAARLAAADALASVREPWEPASTARNLGLIREARAARGEGLPWADAIEAALRARAQALAPVVQT